MLKQDQLLLGTNFFKDKEPTLAPFSLFFAADYSSNVFSFIDNRANKILVLLQLFFHYSSIENLGILPSFIRAVRPLQSLQQLFFLCKVTGPFIYRLSSNTTLLGEILVELFNGLSDLSNSIHLTSSLGLYSLTTHTTNPLSLLEIILDFFYHCKHAFPKLDQQLFQNLRNIIVFLSPELQDRFKHYTK